ncbi:MAG TPA: tetratricopeptide repeat protein [Pyrinomonadaceae bacterium]|nr:tetratricopeptide repeat protein [Pyrinomonadaceae bacterium]
MLANGQILSSRYEITRRLKEGGMGTVYEALDTRLNAHVAVKENLHDEEYLKATFRREAQLLGNLSHPSIPRVLDYFTEGAGQYLVMEFINGEDLASAVARRGEPFAVAEVLGWADQLLVALEYLHGQPTPIMHRDIKPSNLKVRGGRIFLLDFGLAYGQCGEMSTIASSQFNWSGRSPGFAPVEQLYSCPTTPSSDLFSLAATLYLLLTCRQPEHSGARLQALQLGKADPLIDLRLLRPELHEGAARAIMRALALDHNQRPQTAGEMRRLLFAGPPAKPEPKPAAKRGAARVALGAALACVLIVGLAAGAIALGFASSACRSAPDSLVRQVFRCEASADDSGVPAPTPAPAMSEEEAARAASEAETLMQSSRYEDAIAKAREVLDVYPDNVHALCVYGDALWDTSDEAADPSAQMAKVEELADRILELVKSPQAPGEYAARAWANLAKGKYEVAIADATRALEAEPSNVAALMARASGRSMVRGSDQKLALDSLADYGEVIRLMPNYAQARANRASTYADLGQYKLAISDYTEADRLVARARFRVGRGDAYFGLREFDQARRDYEGALKLNPKFYEALVGIGNVSSEEEDWAVASKNYAAALKVRQTSYAYTKRGIAYAKLGQLERAVQDFNAAIGLDPEDYGGYLFRAHARAALGAWDKAVADYTKALELAPDDDRELIGSLYRYRAAAYEQSGHLTLAKADDRRADDLGAPSR